MTAGSAELGGRESEGLAPEQREHLLRLTDYAAKWATAELISGLLQHPKLYAALADGATPERAAALSGLTPRQVGSLLASLEVEQVVRQGPAGFVLTPFGRSLESLRGWLDLFTRGYGGYFHEAAAVWGGRVDPGWRDRREVGLASVRMSEHDALPLVIALMDELNPAATRIVDFGCANGAYLVRLCEQRPDLHGVGLEPDALLVAEARGLVAQRGLDARVEIVHAAAQDFVPAQAPDFVVFAFVLQELTEQISVQGTTELLRMLGRRFPAAHFLAVEVDGAGREDPERMRTQAQRRGYYNYYYLLHDLTEQRLLSFAQWRELFGAAGFAIARERSVDPSVDDTGLTTGFALRYQG